MVVDKSKKTVVFDLDETLVHVNRGEAYKRSTHFVPVVKPDGTEVLVGFNIRPYCREMLRAIKPLYNLVLMTASVRVYAEKVIEIIDPHNEFFQLMICKESCKQYPGGKTIKDLLIFRDLYEEKVIIDPEEDLESIDEFENSFFTEKAKLGKFRYNDIVLVDNFSSAFANQPQNGIPILPYYGATTVKDEELKSLTNFLLALSSEKDMQSVIKNHFLTHFMDESKDIQ